jgi:hypothetical protein
LSVHLVDFRSDRHKKIGKDLISDMCDSISVLDHKVAGYALIAWNDSGYSTFHVEAGGPVSLPLIPSYCHEKLSSLVEIIRK